MKFDTRFFEIGFSYGWRDAHHAPAHGSGVYGSWEEFNGLPKQDSHGGSDFHHFYRGYTTGMKVAATPTGLRSLRYCWLTMLEKIGFTPYV